MKTLPLSEVKARLNKLVDRVVSKDEEIVITRGGHVTAVLMSVSKFEGWKETIAVKSDRELMAEIRKGVRSLKSKKARLYTLDKLFKS